MIELKSLIVAIGNQKILKNINASFQKGHITSILGQSGAGKSTLVRALCGLLEYENGEISIEGHNLKSLSVKEIAKKCSYVSQNLNEQTDFTVNDLMELSKYPFWENSRSLSEEDFKSLDYYLESFDIFDLKYRSLSSLSGGERQRAYIASALFQNSPVVVLDEPTSALDPGHQKMITKILKEEKEQGKTIILVSHDINMAIQMSDNVVALKKGEVVFQGSTTDLLESDSLEEIYSVEFLKIKNDQIFHPILIVKDDL